MNTITAAIAELHVFFMAWALTHADANQPTLYSSRIDGMLFPAGDYSIEVSPLHLSSITVGRCA